jgi:hypothetical protein
VAAEAWTRRATAARLPETPVIARGTNVTTMPAAIATTKKTASGPRRAGVRKAASTPTGRPDDDAFPGRPRIIGKPASAAKPPVTKTGAYPKFVASHTPSDSATTKGTPTATP